MKEKKSLSPVPKKNLEISKDVTELSFPDAIKAIINGNKIHRIEWDDINEYGLLKDNFLMIHRNNKFHTWIISEGDMMALDWIIIK